jgi:formate dehydrogenase major subunit
LGTSFGRGGATTFQQDLQNSDCILIEGSNMAECHPVGFQWVTEAKARGAKVIHVDPRFTRTSALADMHVPLRAGTDIAFLGGIINYVMAKERYFRDYLIAYTNAPSIISEEFRDTEDLDGLFSGLDVGARHYDFRTWQYEGSEVKAPAGERDAQPDPAAEGESRAAVRAAARGEAHGSGGAPAAPTPPRDQTLQHPRCVFQIVKRHFSRYTPQMVEEICGVPEAQFLKVCETLCANSGRERTSSVVYALGWTQHSVGPAEGSWPCGGTPASKVPRTFPPCSTCCPDTSPCPTRPLTTTSSVSSPVRRPQRAIGER